MGRNIVEQTGNSEENLFPRISPYSIKNPKSKQIFDNNHMNSQLESEKDINSIEKDLEPIIAGFFQHMNFLASKRESEIISSRAHKPSEGQICPIRGSSFPIYLTSSLGFGAQFSRIFLSTINALFYNRSVVIIDEKWNYGKWHYLFQCPTNNCLLPDPFMNEEFRSKARKWNYQKVKRKFNFQVPELQQLYTMLEAHRAVAPCIWRLSNVTEFEVNRELERILGKRETSHGFSYPFKFWYPQEETPPFFAIHVERGERLLKESKLVPIKHFLDILTEMMTNQTVSKYLFKQSKPKIFITSDDMKGTLSELELLETNLEFVYRKSEENSSGHFQDAFNELSMNERIGKAVNLVVDIEILRRASLVVCGASSTICQLVRILRTQHPSTLFALNDLPVSQCILPPFDILPPC